MADYRAKFLSVYALCQIDQSENKTNSISKIIRYCKFYSNKITYFKDNVKRGIYN